MSVDGVLWADGLTLGRARTHVSAFPLVLIGHDEVILHRVQDLGPVQGGQVAQVWVFLDPHGTPGDVHQAVEAHLFQLQHLVNDESVVEEQVVPAYHCQVGEQIAEGLEAVDSEQQHVVGHHSQLGEAEAAEVLDLCFKHKQNLQVALDDGAVLHRVEVGHIVTDVFALADWKDLKKGRGKKSNKLVLNLQITL